jgi:Fe-S-cluster containining protein
MNPLDQYREAQYELRALFEPFTRAHCPTCETPCCVRPARLRPVDIILVEELGYPLPSNRAGAAETAAALARWGLSGEAQDQGEPCEFLTARGCAFPPDLRPFGCATFVCEPMRRTVAAEELAVVEAAVASLTEAHSRLMEFLHQPAG